MLLIPVFDFPNMTTGLIPFGNASGSFSQDSNLFWDNNNKRLGVLTSVPTKDFSLGGNAARTFWMERHTTGNTAGNDLLVQAGGATSGATDKNGGNLILSSGLATGTGTSNILFKIMPAGATGTADTTATEIARLTPTDFRPGTNGVPTLGAAGVGWKGIYFDYTNTATVGAVTIDKPSGRVNIAAAGTSVVVTNSLVTLATHVSAWASQADATAQVTSVVTAAGSFTINTIACTAQTSFDFVVHGAD